MLLTLVTVFVSIATAEEAQPHGADRVVPDQTGAAHHQVSTAAQGSAGVLRGGQG